MARKRPGKRPPAQALQNMVPIHKLPRHIERLSDAHVIAWILEATRLTIHEVLTVPAPPRA